MRSFSREMPLAAVLCLGLLSPTYSRRFPQPTSAITAEMRPIRKVITLLEEMKVQAEKDAEADQLTYDKYMCWCTTNRKEKTAAIETAEGTISELSTFLEEATGKAASLKTEIGGLAEEIAADTDAAAKAAAVREEESSAFLAAEADMKETRQLLGEAIKTLGEVQLLQKRGQGAKKETQQAAVALVQVHNIIQQRFPKFQDTMRRDLFDLFGSLPQEVQEQMKQGRILRGHEGVAFQQARLLPWEKTDEQKGMEAKPNDLEGAAAGAKSYNSRSGGILGILSEMKDQFSRDLATAQHEDLEAEIAFQKLKAAKTAEIAAGTKQKGQKEASLAQLLDEKAKANEDKLSMEKAMAADQAFMATLEKNCKEEDEEYKSRVAVRSEEIRALGEALKILTEDDARDLYAKTMSFVQTSSASAERVAAQERAVQHAAQHVAEVARRNKNWKMASLVVRMQLDAFTKVKALMDKMMADLKKQQQEEYAKWEFCKKQIDTTEDDLKVAQNTKKDLNEKHLAIADEIATLADEIAALKKDVSEMEVSLKEAGEQRKAENGVYQTSVSDQRATVNILNKALARLKAFYSFTQAAQEPGAAAPPPPAGGKAYKKGAMSGSVLQLLEKVIKDAEIAEKELEMSEQKAQEDYASFVQGATASIEADRTSIKQREARKAEASAEKSETEEAQLANGDDLAKLGDLLKAHHVACDWLLEYFDVRQKARAEEMDAISDAKAILSGADFA